VSLIKFLETVKKGKIQLNDFELIPYRFSNSFITGKRIEHKSEGLMMYINPVDGVYTASNEEVGDYLYRNCSITYEFNYLIDTSKELVFGSKFWRMIAKKNKEEWNQRCYPITRRIHFQIDVGFGMVIWSFIRRKRRKKK